MHKNITRPSKTALSALDSQQVARLLWRRYIYSKSFKFMKKAIILLSILALTACGLTSYKAQSHKASQAQIDNYFDNIRIRANVGQVHNDKYGTFKASQDPFKTDYDACQSKQYEGKSFVFGTREISDPKKLNQFSHDYFVEYLRLVSSIGKPSARTINTKSIFYDERFSEIANNINKIDSKVLDCVKAKGWKYLSDKK